MDNFEVGELVRVRQRAGVQWSRCWRIERETQKYWIVGQHKFRKKDLRATSQGMWSCIVMEKIIRAAQ